MVHSVPRGGSGRGGARRGEVSGCAPWGATRTELIVCSLEAWDDVWRRNQFLVRELLARDETLHVLFVEPAPDLVHEIRHGSVPNRRGVRPVTGHSRLWTVRPVRFLPSRLGVLSDRGLIGQVRRAAEHLGFESPLLWINDSVYAPIVLETGWPSLYDVTDDWLLANAPPAEARRRVVREKKLIDNAREVVVCSPGLAVSRGYRRLHLIPNAVDVEHFRRPTDRPADLPPGPSVVYVGTLHDERVDIDLVVDLARALSKVHVVLVGPNCLSASSTGRLAGIDNVHLLGARPYDLVPAYLQHADVIVVPHLVTPFTDSLDPIKAYECQVVSTPTVATEVAGFRELAGTSVRSVIRGQFIQEVEVLVTGPRPDATVAPCPPTWADRARDFHVLLEGLRRSVNAPIAIVHDYLTQRGGAERVVLSMLKAFPDAPLYTSLYEPDSTFPEFADADIRTTVLNRLPALRRHHRVALPFLAPMFSRLSVSADVVICMTSGWGHGADVSGRRVVYCLTPARWLYQTDRYLQSGQSLARTTLALLRPWLTRWDQRASQLEGRWLTTSSEVQGRIRDLYGIDAELLPPPHPADPTAEQEPLDGLEPGFVLTVSRLLAYKNVGPTVATFVGLPGVTLAVVGTGPEENRLRTTAPPNVRLLGAMSEAQLRWLYANCSVLLSASYEDFGLTPLEAAAFGKPSVVLRWGGFLDTVVEGETGIFFDEPTPSHIAAALALAGDREWDEDRLRTQADRYSEHAFIERLRALVASEARAGAGSLTVTKVEG